MTQKRKAELQRKLSMAPVKKPPSGLAERIKADIPEYLRPQSDRERFARSWAFTLRIAASIMLLVTSVFLTMQLISRDDGAALQAPAEAKKAEESPKSPSLPLAGMPPPAAQTAAPIPAPVEVAERRQASHDVGARNQAKDQTSDEGSSTEALRVAAAPPAAPQKAEVQDAADVSSALLGGVVADRVERDVAVAAEAPARTIATAPAAVVQFRRSAPPVAETQPFGISTDPSAVAKLKESIKRGDVPPKNVDVAAVVNHFAGAPADVVGAVRLQVEASQAPLKTDGTAIIRYTIDTPENLNAAVVSIVLEKGLIARHRTIGGVRADKAAGSLGAGQSATGLVELKVKPDIRADQLVARVILSYQAPATKQRVVVTSDVRAEHLTHGWAMASRRHRLATLSAAWGESLTSEQVLDGLVGTAAQLAKEAPEDPLAKELAAVTASSRPRSSSPTGSGG
ncbi:MAG: hypothetical protein ACXW2P_01980 [Thermoanaerobaculia bacterium]